MNSQPQLTERQTDALARARIVRHNLKDSTASDADKASLLDAALAYVLDAFTPGGAEK